MTHMLTGPRSARAIVGGSWKRAVREVSAAAAADREVQRYAKRLGIECATQRHRAPRKRQTPESANPGPCRTLSAQEIAALGFQTTKPVEPAREVREKTGPRTVFDWRKGRRLSPDW